MATCADGSKCLSSVLNSCVLCEGDLRTIDGDLGADLVSILNGWLAQWVPSVATLVGVYLALVVLTTMVVQLVVRWF